jgi:hypothetical protein
MITRLKAVGMFTERLTTSRHFAHFCYRNQPSSGARSWQESDGTVDVGWRYRLRP